DTIVIPLRQPEAIDDPLSELAREGARRMLAQVLIAEADSFVAMWQFQISGWPRPCRAPWPWAASGNPSGEQSAGRGVLDPLPKLLVGVPVDADEVGCVGIRQSGSNSQRIRAHTVADAEDDGFADVANIVEPRIVLFGRPGRHQARLLGETDVNIAGEV